MNQLFWIFIRIFIYQKNVIKEIYVIKTQIKIIQIRTNILAMQFFMILQNMRSIKNHFNVYQKIW